MNAPVRPFTIILMVYFLVCGVGFAFVARVFGLEGAMVLSLIPALPLVVAVRMRCRWDTVKNKEFAFLAVLLIVAIGGVIGVVRNWYETGMDHRHAEDVKYAEFGRELLRDPSFRDLKINAGLKNVHWVSGTVASEADLARLYSLAARHGIADRRLDGPYQYRVTIKIAGQTHSK
jgi:hypothetical protein